MTQLNISEILAQTGLTLEQLIAQGKAAEVQKRAQDVAAVESQKTEREKVQVALAEELGGVDCSDLVAGLTITFTAMRTDTGLDDGKIAITAPEELSTRIWEAIEFVEADKLNSIKRMVLTFKPGSKGTVELFTGAAGKTPVTAKTGTAATRGWTAPNSSEVVQLKGAFEAVATPEELAAYATKVGGSAQWQYKNAIVVKAGYTKV